MRVLTSLYVINVDHAYDDIPEHDIAPTLAAGAGRKRKDQKESISEPAEAARQRASRGGKHIVTCRPSGELAAGGCVLVSDSPNPRLGTPLHGVLRQHCREPVDEVPSEANASDSHRPPSKHLRRGGSLQKASGPWGTYETRV